MKYREISSAAEVDAIRDEVETVFDGWYADVAHIDWEDFIDRLENYGYAFADQAPGGNTPAVKRVKAIVKELRKRGQ